MRISTSLSWVCAATLVLGALSAWADPDTEVQAKAREALRKVMSEPPAAPSAPAAPAMAPVAPAPVAAPAPAAAPATAYGGTMVMPPRADPEAIEKARQAVRQQISTLETEPVAPAATPQADARAARKAEAARAREEAAQARAEAARERQARAAQAKADAEAARAAKKTEAEQAKAQAAMAKGDAKAAKAVGTTDPEAARAEAEKQALKAAEKKQAKMTGNLAPMAAPPSSLSATKEARLAELLERYKADKITPQEYHTERAKIVSEP